jgi:hypothetical protein
MTPQKCRIAERRDAGGMRQATDELKIERAG